MIVFVLLILLVQQIDGNLIAPAILGDRTGLSSLGVIIAISVMGDIFGFVGMVIGVPLFALILTILDDMINRRLREKGQDTDINSYYPATAFIRPGDVEENDTTLTQRFVRWVVAVDGEEPDENGRYRHPFRLAMLSAARTVKRVFSVNPIPEDRMGGIFMDIAKHGMNTKRSFWRSLFFSIITIGIYPLYLVEVIAQSLNSACRKDGKRTWGFIPFVLLTTVTLGAYAVIWHCQAIQRMRAYCKRHHEEPIITTKFYLCWTLIGMPILVGPLIALARFIRAFNQVCMIYNRSRTFPLSKEEIEFELAPIPPRPHKRRVPIFSTDLATLIAEAEQQSETELESEAAKAEAAANEEHTQNDTLQQN